MIVFNSVLLASKSLSVETYWPFHAFNICCLGSLVLGFTILYIRWKIIVIGTAFFVICELLLFGYDATLSGSALTNWSNGVIANNEAGQDLLRETNLDLLVLIIARILIYCAQLYIMCFKLNRHRSMDNDDS